MLKLELKPENVARPGFGRLVIHHWVGDTDDITLSIQRNQDQCFLSSDGGWVGNEVRHILPVLQEDGDSCSVGVGPETVDPLLAERQMAYRLTLSGGGVTDQGVLVIAGDVMSSLAGGSHQIPNRLQPLAVPAAQPPEAEPSALPQAEPAPAPPLAEPPQPAPPGKRRSLTWLWLLVALLAVAGAAGAWLWLKPAAPAAGGGIPQATETPAAAAPAAQAPIPAVAPPASAAGAAAPCATATMNSTGELDFVKGCLQSQPNSAQVLAIVDEAKQQRRCDVAQRLYAYKAQSGDTAIALKYAHEYDPLTAAKGGCFNADAETAVYWYETVLNRDANNAEAKARLSALKK